MKIASLVFLVMLSVMALLGSVLLDQSEHTARELAQTRQSLNTQLQQQQDELAKANLQLQSVTQELTQLKATQTSQVPQPQSQPEPLSQAKQVQKSRDKDRQAAARKQDLQKEALQKESLRLAALEESLQQEKIRIQKTQQHIDTIKQQLDTDEKSLDLEMLAAVLEARLQKKLTTMATVSTPAPASTQAVSNLPLKGADQYGELPYRPVPVSVQQVQPVPSDTHTVADITARKNSLTEERKKLWAQQRLLDEDKHKLVQATAQLKQQQQAFAQAVQTAGVKLP
jgi:hypothetical protein